jgi:hypothetical protein
MSEKEIAMAAIGPIAVIVAFATLGAGVSLAEGAGYNAPGNTLIADQFNNRVIEVAPSGAIVWQFGLGPTDVTSTSPVGVNDALRVGENTLVSASGAPPGSESLCPSGCADNRVMLIDPQGKIIWQYGRFGVTGSGHDELNTPVQATWTPMHTILITDQANQRVIEVSRDKKVLWQYGTTGVAGAGIGHLNSPDSAQWLDNGNILIADQSNNRAIEVTRSHRIVATFSAGGTVSAAAFAAERRHSDNRFKQQPGCRGRCSRSDRVVVRDDHIARRQPIALAFTSFAPPQWRDADKRSIQPSGAGGRVDRTDRSPVWSPQHTGLRRRFRRTRAECALRRQEDRGLYRNDLVGCASHRP